MSKPLAALCLFLTLAALSCGGLARAEILHPFATYNQSPLIQIYGLPTAEPAAILDRGKTHLGLSLDVASNFREQSAPGEKVLLDGESYRANLRLRYGLKQRLEIGLDIPYISHQGGFLDKFIDDFHDLFGFPDGGRDQAPRNRLIHSYERQGISQGFLQNSAHGWGDLRLSAGWQLRRADQAALATALRLSLKLPTGDSDQLLGSGSTDLALTLSEQRRFFSDYGPIMLFGSLGGMLTTDGDILKDQRRPLVGLGSLGFGWAPMDPLALKLQVDGHTSFYKDSRLDEIDALSVQLIMGGTARLTDAIYLDLAVSEDLSVGTSADVVFHLALHSRF